MHPWWQRQLHIANSADYVGKHDYFYPLKHSLLLRFGTHDGWDLQTITRFCWNCEGSGIEPYWGDEDEPCEKCGGDGIWSQRKYYLNRWILGDRLYHVPVKDPQPGLPKKSFLGILQHDRQWTATQGRQAMEWLLLRYAPRTWLKLKQRWLVMRVRNGLFYFKFRVRKFLARNSSNIPF